MLSHMMNCLFLAFLLVLQAVATTTVGNTEEPIVKLTAIQPTDRDFVHRKTYTAFLTNKLFTSLVCDPNTLKAIFDRFIPYYDEDSLFYRDFFGMKHRDDKSGGRFTCSMSVEAFPMSFTPLPWHKREMLDFSKTCVSGIFRLEEIIKESFQEFMDKQDFNFDHSRVAYMDNVACNQPKEQRMDLTFFVIHYYEQHLCSRGYQYGAGSAVHPTTAMAMQAMGMDMVFEREYDANYFAPNDLNLQKQFERVLKNYGGINLKLYWKKLDCAQFIGRSKL